MFSWEENDFFRKSFFMKNIFLRKADFMSHFSLLDAR